MVTKKIISSPKQYSFIKKKGFWIEFILWLLFGLCLSFIFNSATYINIKTSNSNGQFGGTLISLVILVSGIFFTPIIGFLTDKLKKSKEVVLCLLLALGLLSIFVYAKIDSRNKFWELFFPTFALFYTYRTIVSGRLSLNSEHLNIPFGITRSTFYIGYGVGSLLSIYIIDNRINWYFPAFAIVVLFIFLYILFLSKNPSLRQKRRIHKQENFRTVDIFKNKLFIYGVIILGIVFGIYESQDFTLQRITAGWAQQNGTNQVLYKSYADLFAIPFYMIGFFVVWKILTKLNMGRSLIYLAFIGCAQVAISAIFLFALGSHTPSKELELFYDFLFGLFEGFFGGALMTLFFEYFALLSSRKQRFKTISIAGGIAFGFFTWLFTFSISQLISINYNNENVAIIEIVFAMLVLLPLLLVYLARKQHIMKLKTKTTIINKIK